MSDIRKLREAVERGERAFLIDFFTPLNLDDKPEDLGLIARNAYNGSLDAAKALHDALLPGWDADIEVRLVLSDATVYGCGLFEGSRESGTDESPARAWLIAILKALEARDNG